MNVLTSLLYRRPRALDMLHSVHLAAPSSQTNDRELAALSRHAAGRHTALEIGTYQGVSAARIASALAADGTLCCVDPWPDADGRSNSCWRIARRHMRRTDTIHKIRILRGLSVEVMGEMPSHLDFAFVDGDHSWDGIKVDWEIVRDRMAAGGIVCLHDVLAVPDEPWRVPDSIRYYETIIANDPAFVVIDSVYTMAVLRKH